MQFPDFSNFNLERPTDCVLPLPDGPFWVFGYGSLMWQPGFVYQQSEPATLDGYHRRLCLWSVRYRGSVDAPGLVLGLDIGGSCHGRAFQVDNNQRDTVCEYLIDREMLSNAYLPVVKPVQLVSGELVDALTFVSKQDHPQYAQAMPVAQAVKIIKSAHGQRGPNEDYVLNTAEHLQQCGIHDTEIHRVAEQLVKN